LMLPRLFGERLSMGRLLVFRDPPFHQITLQQSAYQVDDFFLYFAHIVPKKRHRMRYAY
jgi:hypothetical protein